MKANATGYCTVQRHSVPRGWLGIDSPMSHRHATTATIIIALWDKGRKFELGETVANANAAVAATRARAFLGLFILQSREAVVGVSSHHPTLAVSHCRADKNK